MKKTMTFLALITDCTGTKKKTVLSFMIVIFSHGIQIVGIGHVLIM